MLLNIHSLTRQPGHLNVGILEITKHTSYPITNHFKFRCTKVIKKNITVKNRGWGSYQVKGRNGTCQGKGRLALSKWTGNYLAIGGELRG